MKNQRGFTLIEVVIAIAIFAMLGLGCYKVVHGLALARDTMTKNSEELRQFAKAINTINMDFTQLTARQIRDASGLNVAAFETGGDYLVEFSRVGMQNPLMLKRAKVARVAYQFNKEWEMKDSKNFENNETMKELIGDGKKGYLVRYVWPVLDRGNDEEPYMQILLSGINGVEFEYLSDDRKWKHEWPPSGTQSGSSLLDLPYAIKVNIDSNKYGLQQRLFKIRDLPPKQLD